MSVVVRPSSRVDWVDFRRNRFRRFSPHNRCGSRRVRRSDGLRKFEKFIFNRVNDQGHCRPRTGLKGLKGIEGFRVIDTFFFFRTSPVFHPSSVRSFRIHPTALNAHYVRYRYARQWRSQDYAKWGEGFKQALIQDLFWGRGFNKFQ